MIKPQATMHEMGLNEDDAATAPSAVACPAASGPRWIRIGRGTYPFSTYAEASAAYCATIHRLGLGVSKAPACELLDRPAISLPSGLQRAHLRSWPGRRVRLHKGAARDVRRLKAAREAALSRELGSHFAGRDIPEVAPAPPAADPVSTPARASGRSAATPATTSPPGAHEIANLALSAAPAVAVLLLYLEVRSSGL